VDPGVVEGKRVDADRAGDVSGPPEKDRDAEPERDGGRAGGAGAAHHRAARSKV
jgi:hypothetical protein